MNKRDLLLEIGLEEMPARFVTNSMNQFGDRLTEWLTKKNISYGNVTLYSTPRRLAILVKEVEEKQQDINEEVRGPAKKIALDSNGNWSKAAQGFVKGQGVSVDDITFKEVKGIEYVFVNRFLQGQETFALLHQEVKDIIEGLTFPKNMKWAAYDLKYIRPIQWICALYGNDVIPLSITDVNSSNKSVGHRFLGKEVKVTEPQEYEELLLKEFVIADPTIRKQTIRDQINQLETENEWVIPIDEELLEEVSNLVEYPTAVTGNFDTSFLDIPSEVLITSMKEHQRYFPVKNKNGELLPHFITFRNGDSNHIENVARGNEKVLRARLSDAEFFYVEDQKLNLNDALSKLYKIVFHEDLGTIGDKVDRISYFSDEIGALLTLPDSKMKHINRAAQLCKFDLVTHMVYEFPELQGFMGEKYARLFGESEEVAIAINEHYKPRSASDEPAKTDVGAVVGVADKLDTIVGFFSIGVIPTGSQDPYGLRRQAAGIVQTLLTKKWDVSLNQFLMIALEHFYLKNLANRSKEDIINDLSQFFQLRIKNLLQERGVRYDVIDSLQNQSLSNIYHLTQKADYIMEHLDSDTFKQVIEALSRVTNIANKATKTEVRKELLQQEEEIELFQAYENIKAEFKDAMEKGDMDRAFTYLASLKKPIDNYFDHIMVMAEDKEIRENRLGQMALLTRLIENFAKFNVIIMK